MQPRSQRPTENCTLKNACHLGPGNSFQSGQSAIYPAENQRIVKFQVVITFWIQNTSCSTARSWNEFDRLKLTNIESHNICVLKNVRMNEKAILWPSRQFGHVTKDFQCLSLDHDNVRMIPGRDSNWVGFNTQLSRARKPTRRTIIHIPLQIA